MGLRAKSVSQLFGLFFLAICIFSASSLAQQPKVLAPHKPVAPQLPFTGKWRDPAVLRSVVGGLWMTDANFKSSIHIKNDLKVAPLTVTPILYLSNGQRYQLDSLKLEPSGTAVISVNDALAAQGVAPYATLSGYVEVQYTWSWDAICVTVHNVDAAHSLLFNYNLQTMVPTANIGSSAQQSSILEGLWWKQEPNVTGFLSLSNPSAQSVSAMVQVSDDQGNVLGAHTVDVAAHGTKLLDLQEMQTATSNAGGIRLAYSGPQDSLLVYGGLKDPATGFSANLPLHDPPTPVKHAPSGYVALGMMTGEADPMMLFPAGTKFTPYTVVRNISDKPLSVQPTLYWMQGSASQSAVLPQFTIAPYHTQNLSLDVLLSKAGPPNFNGSVNVSFDYAGTPRSLLIASGSVDQGNTYVFEVHPQGIVESVAKTLSYWSTADGDDTMISLWNPADEAQDFVFTLFFSGGHYNFPLHLGPRATGTFNVSEMIHNQIPDDEGNVIPASVQEGSAEVRGPKGENQHILVSMDAGTYNVRKATCGGYCVTCGGFVTYEIDGAPFAVAVSSQAQLTFVGTYHGGTRYNLTASSSWSSSNNSVGTVSAGSVTGMSAGSLQITAFNDTEDDYYHQCLSGPPDMFCPVDTGGSAEAPGTVDTCSSTFYVSANDINSACVGQSQTATSTLNNQYTSNYSVTEVVVQSDKTISSITNLRFVDVGTYTGGARSAAVDFMTTQPGNLYWTYTMSCTAGTQTASGTQKINCPGP